MSFHPIPLVHQRHFEIQLLSENKEGVDQIENEEARIHKSLTDSLDLYLNEFSRHFRLVGSREAYFWGSLQGKWLIMVLGFTLKGNCITSLMLKTNAKISNTFNLFSIV